MLPLQNDSEAIILNKMDANQIKLFMSKQGGPKKNILFFYDQKRKMSRYLKNRSNKRYHYQK